MASGKDKKKKAKRAAKASGASAKSPKGDLSAHAAKSSQAGAGDEQEGNNEPPEDEGS